MTLQDRVAVITGATGVLGRTVAQDLAQQGVRLVLGSNNMERLQQLTTELNLTEDRALLHAANFSDPNGAMTIAQATHERFGRVDILLNFIGGYIAGKTIVETPTSDVESMLQQHFWSTWHLMKAFIPQLVANNWGRVMVVSSPAAVQPGATSAPYAVAKAAQDTLLLVLAQELRGTNITVNILQVSTIDARHERDHARTPENSSWTTPEEIAATILYLCSEEAPPMSGARIPLFGVR
jgi:NAD(P)-dependent dehydrogenase (short-subunit alcohol dehydrogenase family)